MSSVSAVLGFGEAYLKKPGQKGGTLIAEHVLDIAAHLEHMTTPDGYRPSWCERCKHTQLHRHDVRVRKPRGAPEMPETLQVPRYRCANEGCRAIWLILPQFLARRLWRVWSTVASATEAAPVTGPSPVPDRTVRRWKARLASAGGLLMQVLATTWLKVFTRVAVAAGLGGTRADLVRAFAAETDSGQPLAELASVIHRLTPGVRLM